ncbi:uncharacterized protein B0I36DRAFT_437018 [Microdochium trichocladiopsis]|uniref:Chromo domain-containing protein n=1 Tax=Microdochium trichocladiopsis TaxID=1682393 RepID=A0A9P8XRB9_9PEZI|nr:uncharacterized protein B0I36DRAFT_437018 [Microdochium trichocladiopsis]KAH7009440.1 hypothetical protein B0I36DRAFT_437018 [Microdochium trichocladiopsis]
MRPCRINWNAGRKRISPEFGHHQHLHAEQTQTSQSDSVMETPVAKYTARFEEWPLPNSFLQRTTIGTRTTFRLGITWNANTFGDCHQTGSWDLDGARLESVGNDAFQLQFSWDKRAGKIIRSSSKRSGSEQKNRRVSKKQQVGESGSEDKEYGVECLLEKWGRNTFLVEWEGGQTSWEKQDDINPDLIASLEDVFKSFGCGIEILKVRPFKQGRNCSRKYRVKWKAPGSGQQSWLRASQIDFNVYEGPKPWLN